MDNVRVLVVGGHGKVARLLLPLLVRAGHQVTAVFRDPAHGAEVAETGAAPVVADVEQLDVEAMATLFAGQDAIIWSAGAGGGNPRRTYAVDRDAAIRSMDAALRAGARRYLMVSYFGSQIDHGLSAESDFFPYAEAKGAADAYLASTTLDWTILAPSRLTLEPPTGRIETANQGATAGSVSRADVAAVVAHALVEPATIHRVIRFNAGATAILDALSEDDLA
ncbi:SDR family oxidoreductase [Actinoplanes regularis]|uniref:Putative NADH-flavin reductase n=1 Tax=Actinoplanes regularis TaxID=52697 RepID=A0A239D3I4_9ACTN|nr:SDR family oxidoreductase [Actinoplanes regularis]GIE88433.1 NAD-dependent dehydratase [Actinoplanes regularis]SNS26702.1 Putative NADH-flavin reductase [Actinoplanes regularis]